MRLCANPAVQRSFAWTVSPGVLLPLPRDAGASPELPGRLVPGLPSHPQTAHLQPSWVQLRADHIFPLQVYRVAMWWWRASRFRQALMAKGHSPMAGRPCSTLQPPWGQSGLLKERVGKAMARGSAASRFLRHLGELMASRLAAVICPKLPAVPQFALLGWALLPAPLEAEDLSISPSFAHELGSSFLFQGKH